MLSNIMEQSRYLQMPGQEEQYRAYLKTAQEQEMSPAKFLNYVLGQECALKKEQIRDYRINAAKITEKYVMETFPFDRQPKLDKNRLLTLYDSLDYIRYKQNLIFIGPTGVGKSGLATSFLINAINKGYTGRLVSFADLIRDLMKSEGSYTHNRVIKRYAAYDCLMIDELGYIPIEPAQVGLFFTLIQKRHKRKTTFITTNLGFQDWLSFLKNEHLTAALIDRVTDNSFVMNMLNCVGLRQTLKLSELNQT